MSGPPLIQCQELTKVYPLKGVAVHALRGVDLEIARGEMAAIMGASGSGKSTLMNIIGCMDRQTSGRYHLDGVDVSTLKESELASLRNKKLGFVFQRYNLLPRASALYNVELPLFYAGLSGAEVTARALAALERVGLRDFARHRPNQMSGGQQQRVAIARAMVNNPLVILADEPTGALDTASSAEIMGIFQQMHSEQGVTVVIVTHEPDIAVYCQRKITMRDGSIAGDEPVIHRTIFNRGA
ncbi:ABC transporter ATP-binding protein [Desulfotomaculum copahuensis]|uniref:Macrolide ABC transporter ATP-binding protein n=1 Tax=Desulfotomaculum copahuensis TaxID=1838280 RepID=A0A1B7LGK1_9FIRM|nr:ABC transporter ATP-binding protein [Desulfotomaculum copahuensis]OAT85226.1 macrolide ABC transporter ATP-binding protein [Desulfotomaculum copahuensis]